MGPRHGPGPVNHARRPPAIGGPQKAIAKAHGTAKDLRPGSRLRQPRLPISLKGWTFKPGRHTSPTHPPEKGPSRGPKRGRGQGEGGEAGGSPVFLRLRAAGQTASDFLFIGGERGSPRAGSPGGPSGGDLKGERLKPVPSRGKQEEPFKRIPHPPGPGQPPTGALNGLHKAFGPP
ncbi:proline-rich proteoglycan 2-like, partial [Penaeus monodon]|uniref:proline-rich proteoglycan 2-like n=1 Tax=Penaeus monodon TaxID=6687 RepID=UPI0018A6E81A